MPPPRRSSHRPPLPLAGDEDPIEADPADEESRPPFPAEEDPDGEDPFRTIDRDEEIVRITHARVEHRSLGPPLVPWEKAPEEPPGEKAHALLTPRFGPRSAAG